MSTKIIEIGKKPKLKDPLFIEGLPGVGNVGRIAAGYLVEELKMTKFADVLSSHFVPFVLIHKTSSIHTIKNEFYYWKAKKKGQRDLIILVGDSQSIDPEGHYELSHELLSYVKKLGVKEMITLAGLSLNEPVKKPRVIGAVNDESMIKKYKKYKIDFSASARIGTIVGASGLFLGIGKYYNINGICLLGETIGFPLIPDPKSAEAVLKVLTDILNVKVDVGKLDKKVKEMEDFVKKIQSVEAKAMEHMLKPQAGPAKEDKEKLTYIG